MNTCCVFCAVATSDEVCRAFADGTFALIRHSMSAKGGRVNAVDDLAHPVERGVASTTTSPLFSEFWTDREGGPC